MLTEKSWKGGYDMHVSKLWILLMQYACMGKSVLKGGWRFLLFLFMVIGWTWINYISFSFFSFIINKRFLYIRCLCIPENIRAICTYCEEKNMHEWSIICYIHINTVQHFFSSCPFCKNKVNHVLNHLKKVGDNWKITTKSGYLQVKETKQRQWYHICIYCVSVMFCGVNFFFHLAARGFFLSGLVVSKSVF